MNFLNKFLLWFALLPSSLYRKIGVDTRHLEIILTAKLMMDDRRPNTFHQTRQKKSDKAISGATIGTMIFSALLGFLFLFSFRISDILVTQLTFYFSMYIFMLASTLISDFTSVLIDVRDNYIILPKPVTDKTFVLSRLLHILIHVTKIIFPLAIPAVGYVGFFHGYWPAIAFFLVVLSATAFTVFLINIIYLLILRVTSPRKFQNVISYVQIAMTVIIFAGYQLMPSLINKITTGSYNISINSWVWILPSYWLALGWQFFAFFSVTPALVTGATITLFLPPLSLLLVTKYFAPSFNEKLSLITTSSEESAPGPKTSIYKQRPVVSFADRLAKVFAKKGEERTGFLITWKLTARLKDFRLKVYPSVGYLLVFFVLMLMNNKGFSFDQLKDPRGGARTSIVTMIYSCSFLLVLALGQLQYSDKFKAAWFYFTTPITKPGLIFTGAVKAVVVKFYLPIAMLVSVIGTMFIGVRLLPNILLGISNVLLSAILLSLLTLRNFPFSASQQTSQKAGALFRGFISMIIVFTLGLAHFLIYNIQVVVIISLVLSSLANWLLFDYMKNKSWKKIIATYKD